MRTIDCGGQPLGTARLLLDSWLHALSAERLGATAWGQGGDAWARRLTFGEAGKQFQVIDDGETLVLDLVEGLDRTGVESVLDDALARVAAHDLGGRWFAYATEATIDAVDILGEGKIHFPRVLGGHPHIEGARRMSDLALLDFEEGVAARHVGPFILPLATTVRITAFAQGPASSELTHLQAAIICELAAAACALVIGRPVRYQVPNFPLENEDEAAALARRRDPEILGIDRDYVSLDIFADLFQLGHQDAVDRARGSLLAYHAALKQENVDVAVMLLVTSIEALIAPRPTWGKTKVTSRFIKSLVELCPDAVDDLVGHRNVEEAFGCVLTGGLSTRRRELLSRIYETRSLPTHTGLAASASTFGLTDPGAMRVALLDDLARSAILAYLEAPRSSVVGHPMYDAPDEGGA